MTRQEIQDRAFAKRELRGQIRTLQAERRYHERYGRNIEAIRDALRGSEVTLWYSREGTLAAIDSEIEEARRRLEAL